MTMLDENGLAPEGLRAFEAALALVPDRDDETQRDACLRYAYAVDRAIGARLAWERDGRMLTIEHPNGTIGRDAMLAVLEQAERHAERLRVSLPREPKRPGRPPSPDRIGTLPAPRLRPVKSSRKRETSG